MPWANNGAGPPPPGGLHRPGQHYYFNDTQMTARFNRSGGPNRRSSGGDGGGGLGLLAIPLIAVLVLSGGGSCGGTSQNKKSAATSSALTSVGTWAGTYTCNQGLTNLKLTVERDTGVGLTARFDFDFVPTSSSPPGEHAASGSFSMRGAQSGNRVQLSDERWIDKSRAPTYYMIDLTGTLSSDSNSFDGQIQDSKCGAFNLVRQS